MSKNYEKVPLVQKHLLSLDTELSDMLYCYSSPNTCLYFYWCLSGEGSRVHNVGADDMMAVSLIVLDHILLDLQVQALCAHAVLAFLLFKAWTLIS